MIILYGAMWSEKSVEVASKISNMLIDLNPENEDATQNIAAFYISNDRKSSEFE